MASERFTSHNPAEHDTNLRAGANSEAGVQRPAGSTPRTVAAEVAQADAEVAAMRAISDATGSGAPKARQGRLSGGPRK